MLFACSSPTATRFLGVLKHFSTMRLRVSCCGVWGVVIASPTAVSSTILLRPRKGLLKLKQRTQYNTYLKLYRVCPLVWTNHLIRNTCEFSQSCSESYRASCHRRPAKWQTFLERISRGIPEKAS